MTLKSRSNQRWSLSRCIYVMHLRCKFGDRRSVAWTEQYTYNIFYGDLKPSKIGQGDLIIVARQGSLVGLCTINCKSLCAVVTICVTLFNIQTDTPTHRQTAFGQLIR